MVFFLTKLTINIVPNQLHLHSKQAVLLIPLSITKISSIIRAFYYLFKLNISLKMAKGNVSLASLDHKLAMAKRYSHEGVMAGAKAAVVAGIASAIPTLVSVRMLPWAKANLNPTAQALIISTVAGAAYFIVADKTVLATARKNSFKPPSNS